MEWGAIIGGIVTIIGALIAWRVQKRERHDNLAQAEVDELKDQMDHPRTEPDPTKRLFMDKPKAGD